MEKNSKQQLVNLLNAMCVDNDYELIDVHFLNSPPALKLVVYIDKPGGINIDDCVQFNKIVNGTTDLDDLIDSSYLLEVSSPGPQRPLRSISDFVQHKGKKVKIKLSVPYEGKRDVFVGQVESVKEDCINISDSGELYTIKYANIEKANLNL